MNQREVTLLDQLELLLWSSQKVLPQDNSGKCLLEESCHAEGCKRDFLPLRWTWDPPQSHQFKQEVLCQELKQTLQVPCALHAWATLSCVQKIDLRPDEPLRVLNLPI